MCLCVLVDLVLVNFFSAEHEFDLVAQGDQERGQASASCNALCSSLTLKLPFE